MKSDTELDVATEAAVPEPAGTRRLLRDYANLRTGAPLLERYAGVILLVVLIVTFSLLTPDFLTYRNLLGIAQNQAIQAILSLGLLFPLACGVFDVSVAGVMTLAIVAVTWLFQSTNGGMPIWAAVIIVLVVVAVAGLVNAVLIVRIGIDPFIATIGTGSIFEGFSQMIGNGSTITFHIPAAFTRFGIAKLGGVPVDILIVLVLAFGVWYVLSQMPVGRSIYATGAARDAARLSGIRTGRVLTGAYVASALGAGVAGILFAAEQGAGPPGVGQSFLLPAYATVFLGATIIRPGRFNVGGLIVAILIISVGINGIELLGGPFWVENLFEGVALIGAVAVTRIRANQS
ncbi:MAG: monosaccharide transporter rane protein family [Ilumatobacteraceae bacterium]|nr:monosaccharide transporter rane protein family [Ilumatobacteraceae bacterium]